MTVRIFSVSAIALLSACANSGTQNHQMSLNTYGYSFPPIAFYTFCETNSRLCNTSSGEKHIVLSDQRYKELRNVNTRVNRQIEQRADAKVYGQKDVWSLPDTVGDCEDFAIMKKDQLLKLGWPSSVLLLTVVKQPFSEEGHTLLTVRTSKGDIVLDNATDQIKLWHETKYRFFSVQAQGEMGKWLRVVP
ncbi:transglutaminase-like cysteine peptidase [Fulvimarina pelagi]|nr:transglutaminase-like cysteine peptidase [Fulvimarina pelagi]